MHISHVKWAWVGVGGWGGDKESVSVLSIKLLLFSDSVDAMFSNWKHKKYRVESSCGRSLGAWMEEIVLLATFVWPETCQFSTDAQQQRLITKCVGVKLRWWMFWLHQWHRHWVETDSEIKAWAAGRKRSHRVYLADVLCWLNCDALRTICNLISRCCA